MFTSILSLKAGQRVELRHADGTRCFVDIDTAEAGRVNALLHYDASFHATEPFDLNWSSKDATNPKPPQQPKRGKR